MTHDEKTSCSAGLKSVKDTGPRLHERAHSMARTFVCQYFFLWIICYLPELMDIWRIAAEMAKACRVAATSWTLKMRAP